MSALPGVERVGVPQPVGEVRHSSRLCLKVKRAVTFAFEVLAILGAFGFLAAVLTGHISAWHGFTSLFLSCAAKAARASRKKMHDFENPEELQKMRAAAPHMSYSELREAFHWTHLKQHNLVPIEGVNGVRHKVLLYLGNPDNFDSMGSGDGAKELNLLLQHGIINVAIATAVRGGNQGWIQNQLQNNYVPPPPAC